MANDSGTQSDGEMAARAFAQQADPIAPGDAIPPKEPGAAVPPVTTQREPVPPVDVWATGAGEK
jgi:hypothetical protein